MGADHNIHGQFLFCRVWHSWWLIALYRGNFFPGGGARQVKINVKKFRGRIIHEIGLYMSIYGSQIDQFQMTVSYGRQEKQVVNLSTQSFILVKVSLDYKLLE